jgi:DNA-binding XRE family transcriptional regulator
MDFDFSVLAKAGLTQDDFAKLVGVSRVSVNMWMRGKVKPHTLVHDKITKLLVSVEYAVDNGFLPLQERLARGERFSARKAALVAALKHRAAAAATLNPPSNTD